MPPQAQPISTKDLVDMVLFSSPVGRRELQSSPILGDVWLKYAESPNEAVELLITPLFGIPAGPLAKRIAHRIEKVEKEADPQRDSHDPRLAYLQGLIAARLTFSQLIRIVLPMSAWWHKNHEELHKSNVTLARAGADEHEPLGDIIKAMVDWMKASTENARSQPKKTLCKTPEILRLMVLGALIVLGEERVKEGQDSDVDRGVIELLKRRTIRREVTDALTRTLKVLVEPPPTRTSEEGSAESNILSEAKPWVFQVSLNRDATPALKDSVPAVKGDAARQLFDVHCHKIAWAVLDSGIDGQHPAFYDPEGNCRIVKSLDFGFIRDILSVNQLNNDKRSVERRINQILEYRQLEGDRLKDWIKLAKRNLPMLIEDAGNDRPLLWQLVEPLIAVDPVLDRPESDHGTHVAGILAANAGGVRRIQDTKAREITQPRSKAVQGLCPEIKLYDLRVLGRTNAETEFGVIAALQYIRQLNDRLGFREIHGANLSLQLPHNVRNWACGQTPVCIECENLINSGVVVVAAAGNFGYQSLQTDKGPYDGYVALSITDPGNADGVITVGATHRYWPHTYGVSFFSSRGPTGDGRLKPDLVAPGERITSCLCVQDEETPRWGEMDGTSMAAPHVSGAAAMLLARYTELQGRPRVVKEVLCSTATDLARERSFQG
ncbi:MAG: S8 family peptidase, partial [Planctomycetaceae bacterium]